MFNVGEIVSYGLHGRCQVISIDEMKAGGQTTQYYSLQTTKTVGSKNQGTEAKVLVPVDQAEKKGLRAPIQTEDEITAVLEVLGISDTYFKFEEHWKIEQKKIDDLVRDEGAIGLAKALGHLHVAQETATTPLSSEAIKYLRLIKRILAREIADALNDKSTRQAERLINKALTVRMEELRFKAEHDA